MIVQNFVQSPVLDGTAKTQSKGDGGNGFGRAMRDAADKKPGVSDKLAGSGSGSSSLHASATETTAEASPGVRATDGSSEDKGAERKADDKSGEGADRPEDLLRGLLGLLAPETKSTKGSDATSEGEGDQAPAEKRLSGTDLGEQGEGGDTGTEGATRLKVLRMETHFEPGQEGMVVVDGASGSAAPLERFELNGKADSAQRTGLKQAASMVGNEDVPQLDRDARQAASGNDGGEGQGSVRVGFGEAVARLGRGDTRSGRGKEDSSRDASPGRAASGNVAKQDDVRANAANATNAMSNGASVPTMTVQIADTIIDALGQSASEASRTPGAATAETHVRMRAGGAALKTLTIQLQPEHLGTLEVSMRLVDDKLTLELSASRDDTAVALMNDREGLRKLLEHAGFSLDDAAIKIAVKDHSHGAAKSSDGSGSNPNQARQDGQATSGGERQNGGSGSSNDGRGRAMTMKPADDAAGNAGRSGSTYL